MNAGRVHLERLQKDARSTAIEILRKHPLACVPTVQFLASIGYTADTPVAEQPQSKETEARVRAHETRKAKSQTEKQEVEATGGDMIQSKYNTLEALSEKMLITRVCPMLDPVSMSAGNMTRLMQKGMAMAEKKRVLMCTGECGSLRMVGALRTWSALLAHLKTETEARGHRMANQQVPITWESSGVYMLEVLLDDEEVVVTQRFTEQKKKFDWSSMSPVPKPGNPEMSMLHNYSEKRASIQYIAADGKRYSHPVADQFTGHRNMKRGAIEDAQTPSPKKRLRVKTPPSESQ
eukprot:6200517-Amphidinium_carterae.1